MEKEGAFEVLEAEGLHDTVDKQQVYKRIKILGMLSYIPMVVAVGPLSGYWAGDFCIKKFGWGWQSLFICIGLGSLASIAEVARIIRLVIQIDKKSLNS